ncbi:MAG: IclR family transcriptional regulator, partial [Mesorhizobium sp.]
VRVTPERLAEIGPLVRDAATEITRMIGGLPPPSSPIRAAEPGSLFEIGAARSP